MDRTPEESLIVAFSAFERVTVKSSLFSGYGSSIIGIFIEAVVSPGLKVMVPLEEV